MRSNLRLLAGTLATIAFAAGCSGTPEPSRTTIVGAPPLAAGTGLRPVSSPPSTLISQEEKLLNAVNGAWSGPAGTITFGNASAISITIHDCPLAASGPQFGYHVDCPERTITGQAGYGSHEMGIAISPSESATFAVYVDGDNHLHIGTGVVFDINDAKQGTIAAGENALPVTIDGDRCRQSSDTDPAGTTPIACSWQQREGVEVLEVGGQVFIHDAKAGVMATPTVYYSVFTRRS